MSGETVFVENKLVCTATQAGGVKRAMFIMTFIESFVFLEYPDSYG